MGWVLKDFHIFLKKEEIILDCIIIHNSIHIINFIIFLNCDLMCKIENYILLFKIKGITAALLRWGAKF